jgi:hypothetical protein
MDFTTAIARIRETETTQKMVAVEYLGFDGKRGSGGKYKTVTGVMTGAGHETMKHGTMVFVDQKNKHHTVHTALIMKINNEFVD